MADTPKNNQKGAESIQNATQNTTANDDTAGESPLPPATKTDDQHIQEWLKRNLVEIKNDHGITCEIDVEEYLDITTTHSNDRQCWLEYGSINLALALLTQREARKDVCALTIQHGMDLFWVGYGTSKMSDLLTDPFIGPALKDEEKRFIVVPVNDGPLQFARQQEYLDKRNREKQNDSKDSEDSEEESTEGVEESDATEVEEDDAQDEYMTGDSTGLQRAEENALMPDVVSERDVEETEETPEELEEPPTEQQAYGSHWGLLVIDKQERRARWIDGSLDLRKKGNHPHKKQINGMSEAAIVAGKILCGIEQVLGSERGKFDAKTAKYVPHQVSDNRFQADPGACGPYVYAFLDHLYKNPEYMEKLRGAFRCTKWNEHRSKMDFDSLYTRVAMQKIIQDKSEEDSRPDELALKMTPDVFRILQPKVLAPWVATAYRSYHPSKPSDSPELFDRFDFRKHCLGFFGGGRGSGGGGGDDGGDGGGSDPPRSPPWSYDTDEEDREDDNFIYDMNNPGESMFSKRYLRQIIGEKPDFYNACETKEDAYRLAYEMAREEQRNIAAIQPDANTAAGNTSASKGPPRRSCDPLLRLPGTISEMPTDFADPHQVPSKQLKQWREHNLAKIEQCKLGPKATEDGVSVRAILQVLSGVRFTDESEHRLTTIWIKDPDVFTDEERKDGRQPVASKIAERMASKYEVFKMANKTAAKRTHSGGEETGASKKARMVDFSALGMIGEETPDFTHMTSSQVREWVELLPKIVATPASPMDTWSQKAVLQNIFGRFNDLSEADKSLWLKNHPVLKSKKAGIDDVIGMLQNSVKEIPSCKVKGVIIFYPKSYQDEFAKRQCASLDTSEEPNGQTGEGDPDDYFV